MARVLVLLMNEPNGHDVSHLLFFSSTGQRLLHNRYIGGYVGLSQEDSVVSVQVDHTAPRNPWMPTTVIGGRWQLPIGWNDGLDEVLDEHDRLVLPGRTDRVKDEIRAVLPTNLHLLLCVLFVVLFHLLKFLLMY